MIEEAQTNLEVAHRESNAELRDSTIYQLEQMYEDSSCTSNKAEIASILINLYDMIGNHSRAFHFTMTLDSSLFEKPYEKTLWAAAQYSKMPPEHQDSMILLAMRKKGIRQMEQYEHNNKDSQDMFLLIQLMALKNQVFGEVEVRSELNRMFDDGTIDQSELDLIVSEVFQKEKELSTKKSSSLQERIDAGEFETPEH